MSNKGRGPNVPVDPFGNLDYPVRKAAPLTPSDAAMYAFNEKMASAVAAPVPKPYIDLGEAAAVSAAKLLTDQAKDELLDAMLEKLPKKKGRKRARRMIETAVLMLETAKKLLEEDD